VKIQTLYTCCEQVGRRGKGYEMNYRIKIAFMKELRAGLIQGMPARIFCLSVGSQKNIK
jgi:hypothetical protein